MDSAKGVSAIYLTTGKHLVVMGALLLNLAACQSVKSPSNLLDLADSPDANTIILSETLDGLMVVPLSIDGVERPFIMDTGATRSVLFRDAMSDIDALDLQGTLRIHGMFGTRDAVGRRVGNVSFGRSDIGAVDFALLDRRRDDSEEADPPIGIIGLDILRRFRLFAPESGGKLVLLESDAPRPIIPDDWGRVELETNPFGGEQNHIRFMTVRVGGRTAPALLDTGSTFNLASWSLARWPQVRHARKQLNRRVQLDGAVASAKPRVSIRAVDLRAGSHIWHDMNLIVQDIDSLGILGIDDQPVMIAGVDLLADRTFYLDWDANELRLPKNVWREPSPAAVNPLGLSGPDLRRAERQRRREERRARQGTGSRVGSRAATVVQAEPEARNR